LSFSAWLRCSPRSVSHVFIDTLLPSLGMRLASRKKSCVTLLSGSKPGQPELCKLPF
jgi:hypothetical protein